MVQNQSPDPKAHNSLEGTMDDQPSMNSCSYRGFDDGVINVDDERRNDSSCPRDISSATEISTVEDPSPDQYHLRVEVDVAGANPPPYYSDGNNSSSSSSIATTRSIRSISKDMIRTFQNTIQNNSGSQILLPENAPVSPMFQPRLQKLASETRRIVQSVQQNAIVEGMSDTLVNVNDRLGSMLLMRSSKSMDVAATTTLNIDRGIYSSHSMRSWGSTVTAEISTFTSQKVVPLFKRQNTYPFTSGTSANQKEQHVSFDYQLMKDNE